MPQATVMCQYQESFVDDMTHTATVSKRVPETVAQRTGLDLLTHIQNKGSY
jgi:hypothetical protein